MSAALIVLLGLGAWEAIVRLGWVDELILPAPTQVLDALWTDRSLLAPDLAVTTSRRRSPPVPHSGSPCTSRRVPDVRSGRW